MRTLEKKLEDPEQPDRVRLLGGKDPTPTELHNKLEEVGFVSKLYISYTIIHVMCMINDMD